MLTIDRDIFIPEHNYTSSRAAPDNREECRPAPGPRDTSELVKYFNERINNRVSCFCSKLWLLRIFFLLPLNSNFLCYLLAGSRQFYILKSCLEIFIIREQESKTTISFNIYSSSTRSYYIWWLVVAG